MSTFGDIRSAVAANHTRDLLFALAHYQGNPEEALCYVRDSWGYIPSEIWESSNYKYGKSVFDPLRHGDLDGIRAWVNVGNQSVKIGEGSQNYLCASQLLYPFKYEIFLRYWLPNATAPHYDHINKRLIEFFWNLKNWSEGRLTYSVISKEAFYVQSELADPYKTTPQGLAVQDFLNLNFQQSWNKILAAHQRFDPSLPSAFQLKRDLETRFTQSLLMHPLFLIKYWSFGNPLRHTE